MARERNLTLLSFPASTDLSTKQYYATTINSSGQLALATAAKNCDGILQDKPSAQGQVGTLGWHGVTKAAISASSNIAIGDLLEVDTAGTLKKLASGTAVAKALEAVNVASVTVITVLLLKSNAVYS